MVRAALGDEDLVAVLQGGELCSAGNQRLQLALVAGKEDGKRGKRNFVGHKARDPAKGLRVCDHHGGGSAKRAKRARKLLHLAADDRAVRVEHVADGLLLGQNEPALGRRLVDGDHKHHHVALRQQIRHDAALGEPGCAAKVCKGFFQLVNAASGQRAEIEEVLFGLGHFGKQVRLIVCADHRDLALGKAGKQALLQIRQRQSRVMDQHSHVDGRKDLGRLFDTKRAKLALVVQTRGVDDDDRTQRQQLHRLFYGVCGGALDRGDHRQILAGHGVDQA